MTCNPRDSLLLIEDHADIATMLCSYFERRGFTVDYAADGLTGLHLAVEGRYDAIVLDRQLPGLDGLSLCRKLREEARDNTPIVMLTARDTVADRVEGLDSGADDYLIKPFAINELEARVRSQIRRHRGEVARERLVVGDLVIDDSTHRVERQGRQLSLTPTAYRILLHLARSSPAVVPRPQLERRVWGDILPDSDTLRSHVYALRKIIDKPFGKPLLQTVPGTGYQLVAD